MNFKSKYDVRKEFVYILMLNFFKYLNILIIKFTFGRGLGVTFTSNVCLNEIKIDKK